MSLVLVGEGGQRSSPFLPLGGTVVLARSEPNAGGGSEDRTVPDKVDLAFDLAMAADPQLLKWISRESAGVTAELTLFHGRKSIYTLSGLVSRNVTVTQSQDGTGQASLVLGAQHATVDGIVMN